MELALALARQARLICPPNPAVGAVLVNPAGRIIGQGHTQVRGGPHAEVMALRDAQQHGHDTHGATAYVTLEPCSHQGRTGPCCDALIAAGIRRVVASVQDPNPLVAGQGFTRLRAAGIEVEIGAGAADSQELNVGFFTRMGGQGPWLRCKLAGSLDGRSALDNGASQWITSAQARSDGHGWRARACAILTGIGTVLTDDPLLNVRGFELPREPHLVIVDSHLRTPPTARLFEVQRQVLIYTTSTEPASALEARGATVVRLAGAQGRVDLPGMLADLAQREVNEVHLEAGPTLSGAMAQAGLIDEYLLYLAPRLLGPGRPLLELPAWTALDQTLGLRFTGITPVGPDLRLLARPERREA